MFIQNRAKSIAQRLNAKNIAPLREKIAKFADKIKFKKPLKSFCFVWLLPKVESLPLPLKHNLPNKADSANVRIKIDDVICVDLIDSAESQNLGENISSLRENTKYFRGNPQDLQAKRSNQPPCKKNTKSQGGLPRRFCESARNDEYLDSSLAPLPQNDKIEAENDNLGARVAESREKIKSKKPFKSFCFVWLLPNEESPLPLNPNLPNNADSINNIFSELESLLQDLKPWRKGPFNFCGIEVQSEWDSAIKFNIIAPHLSVEGKVVADIGCNNGYYSFRLLPLRPSKIVGFEPSAHCKMQFDLINAFVKSEICFEMLGVEDLADYDCKFDCILCLGVLYHRTNPLDCLKILKSALNPNGELIIDTLIIEGEDEIVLSPLSYAKMKNVYFIPSIRAFQNWLKRAGFKEIELLEVRKTTSIEQRKTAWSGGESLEDFLDKNDKNKTIEGYNAPTRAYFKAKI